MTIIAGFKCRGGIVICADTQETVEHAKRHVPKLRFEPSPNAFYGRLNNEAEELAVAFCGAGSGPLIDKLADEAWKAAKGASSLDEACFNIEDNIKRQYKELGQIYQPGYCPEVQLIFGVKMQRKSRLFTAYGPIVNEKHGCDSGGVGHYMADFLVRRMYRQHLNIHQCVILAAYILFQAKEHVDGCGGDSHIAVLREDGTSGLADRLHVDAITKILDSADRETGGLLLNSANLDTDDQKFLNDVKVTITLLDTFRKSQREEIRQWAEVASVLGPIRPTDSFGLPMPLNSETSEPE